MDRQTRVSAGSSALGAPAPWEKRYERAFVWIPYLTLLIGAILSQEIGVPLEAARHPVECHAASDPALDRGVAIQLEVDSGDAAHRSQDAAFIWAP